MSDERKLFGFLVQVTLSQEELDAMKDREIEITRERFEVEREKTAASSQFSERLKTLKKEQLALLEAMASKVTKTEVECYHEKDERRGMMLTRRADNGFIVDERALTVDELNADRQGDLFDGNAAAPAPPSDEEFTGDAAEQERPVDADAASALESYKEAVGDDEDGDADPDDELEPAPAVN